MDFSTVRKSDRAKVRNVMLAEAEKRLAKRIGLFSTAAQIKAGARKLVDQAIAAELAACN